MFKYKKDILSLHLLVVKDIWTKWIVGKATINDSPTRQHMMPKKQKQEEI